MSPLTISPAKIENSDFSLGWIPDYEETAIPPEGLLDSLNVMLEKTTGAVVTREGYKRLSGFAVSGYRVVSMHPYRVPGSATQYLMVVVTSDTATVNNVQVWAFNLTAGTSSQVSPSDVEWDGYTEPHYGITIHGTYYGGSTDDLMYSWNPTDGWDADPSTPTLGNYVDSNKAYKKDAAVAYTNGKNYSAARNNRFDKWENATHYEKGDLVSKYDSGVGYWRSWRCFKEHTAETGVNEPGTGSGFWRGKRLQPPIIKDADNSTDIESGDWYEIPSAPITNVAAWNVDRVFARYDNVDKQYVLYSGKARTEGAAKLVWDAEDWRVTDDMQGAGYIPFKTEEGDDITAIRAFGYYTLVFKRHSAHAIAGANAETWSVVNLDPDIGCLGQRAGTEHEGMFYFLSDQGLQVTDGTDVQAAPGAERIRAYVRNALDWNAKPKNIKMWSYDGYVWISLPTGPSQDPNVVLVYEPDTGSFWRQRMRVTDVAIVPINGLDQMLFATPTKTGTYQPATYAWTGTALQSSSTRTIGASTVTNRFTNPAMEVTLAYYPPEDITALPSGMKWDLTDAGRITVDMNWAASHQGILGAEISVGEQAATYRGITQTFADASSGDHRMSFKVRRADWKKNALEPPVKFRIGSTDYVADSTAKLDNGWWRFTLVYAGSTSPRAHGVVVKPGRTVHVDEFIATSGTTDEPWFSGYGGESVLGGTFGGGSALVMQYGHPDSNHTDDRAQPSYDADYISWGIRTAWYSFSSLKEERQVRHLHAMVRAKDIVPGLVVYTDYKNAYNYRMVGTAPETSEVTYFQGKHIEACHAFSVVVAGLNGPAAILGVGADTIFLRNRSWDT